MSGFSGMLSSGMSAIGNLWSSDAPVNQVRGGASLAGLAARACGVFPGVLVRAPPLHATAAVAHRRR